MAAVPGDSANGAAAPVDRLAARAGSGRRPGRRALETRARISACVEDLVAEVPYRELTTALVSQRLGLSPGTFYRYFADISDAILELTATMRTTADAIAAMVREGDWDRADNATALAVIDAMAGFWAEHRPLYRVTDLCADEGDRRFSQVKATTFSSLTEAFREVIARSQAAGRHPGDLDPFAAACVVVATLIHTMARERAFGLAGVGPGELRSHLARVVRMSVTGTAPRPKPSR